MLRNVVLPEPDGPVTDRNSPSSTVSERPRNAWVSTVLASAVSGSITNVGTVESDTPDPNLDNNSDDATVDVVIPLPPTTVESTLPVGVVHEPTGSVDLEVGAREQLGHLGHHGRVLGMSCLEQVDDARQTAGDVLGLGHLPRDLGQHVALQHPQLRVLDRQARGVPHQCRHLHAAGQGLADQFPAGAAGRAYSLVSADEIKQLNGIEQLIQRHITREYFPGFEPDHEVPDSAPLRRPQGQGQSKPGGRDNQVAARKPGGDGERRRPRRRRRRAGQVARQA